MRIGIIPYMFMVGYVVPVCAQTTDTLQVVDLNEVVISETFSRKQRSATTLQVDVAGKEFLERHFTGNLVQTLEHIPGVRSMDIGSGFSKPMIRGMAFNRITVTENGIKQEGQQWGADHGLEIDAFNSERVVVRKGPSSLLYGSDAMGGAIEISQLPAPLDNQVYGEAVLLGKSVNGTIGGSVMLGIKHDAWHTKIRFSEQHYGDYRVPADTVVYLTQKLPIHNNRLKNTAGYERNINFFTAYQRKGYSSNLAIGNAYQKNGFFPGAHGIPDASRLEDDGNSRDIGLPYSTVNHFKLTTHQQYIWDNIVAYWDFGYQYNRRQEWSRFHTHYGTEEAPEVDPDKELGFYLHTFSSSFRVKWYTSAQWEHTAGWDVQYQRNTIDGYSFLLPEYTRFTTGWMWLTNYRFSDRLLLSGGARFDYGNTDIYGFRDTHLEAYLDKNGYSEETIESYSWRSQAVKRTFGDYSASIGLVWTPVSEHTVKLNTGRSFRLPGTNELASNGVHHGTFRHEQGNESLDSERGWQIDMTYSLDKNWIEFSVSPFASWYTNYIFLNPTGEWSILPHSGQIYRYTGAKAIFMGAEASADIEFLRYFRYHISGEYVYTYNRDENIPLSFSPPASMRNSLTGKWKSYFVTAEWESIASQNRVARNEEPTPGANLLHIKLGGTVPIGKLPVDIQLSARNLLDKRYYNHLSFYRKIEIPEPGRNFQLMIRMPFTSK